MRKHEERYKPSRIVGKKSEIFFSRFTAPDKKDTSLLKPLPFMAEVFSYLLLFDKFQGILVSTIQKLKS